jgi:hypothetical protein
VFSFVELQGLLCLEKFAEIQFTTVFEFRRESESAKLSTRVEGRGREEAAAG